MIDIKERTILNALKRELLKTKRVTEKNFFNENECATEKCIYYLRRFEDNLWACNNAKHYQSFKEGMGRELDINRLGVVPMASLRSSAALAWNIFGDEDTCHINSIWNHLSSGEYELKYEWESETINSHNASIDAHLFLGNCHLFVEMKMLEPLKKTHRFESYNSYINSDNCPPTFKAAFEHFEINKPEYFDACQMLKHLLAIFNYFKYTSYKEPQNIVLLNCHWEPQNRIIDGISLEKTYSKFNKYADDFEEMRNDFQKLFSEINVNLVLDHCNHYELIEIVGKKEDQYLKRYDIR